MNTRGILGGRGEQNKNKKQKQEDWVRRVQWLNQVREEVNVFGVYSLLLTS